MSVKISELPNMSATDVSNTDFIPVVDIPSAGTTRTKKLNLIDLFAIAPVRSVNGLDTGHVSLASTDLTDASNIGRILDINGHSSGNVSLGSQDLTDASDIALVSDYGTHTAFANEYNNPTTGTLQTEFEELARLVGNDVQNVRTSLFAVQQTANDAMPTQTANNTFATKVSLGDYTKTTDIQSNYYTKNASDLNFATKVSLGDYTKTADIQATYYTKGEVDNLVQQNSGSGSSVFTANHLTAQSASIFTSLHAGSLSISGDASIGGSLTALGILSSLRAEVGDGTTSGVGSSSALYVKGNAKIDGSLVADSFEVLGSTIIKNTQLVQVSDDFVEVNEAGDGSMTGNVAGIKVNRGTNDDAEFSWDNSVSLFQIKVGQSLADLRANRIEFQNTYASTADMPAPNLSQGMFAYDEANQVPVFSNGTSWLEIGSTTEIGTIEQFNAEFTIALAPDTDGDGSTDLEDAFPNDPNETTDTDGDGVGDNADVFPNDPSETIDTDGDGVGDNSDAFPNDASESADTDGDGTGDNTDEDIDGDGILNIYDAFPYDASETADTDGDGVGDNADAFPNDASETTDTDGDGTGDNADAFPTDASETTDTDGDGIGDNTDPDIDDDGVLNAEDAFPYDATETTDTDGDGVGDNADEFPNDPTLQKLWTPGDFDTIAWYDPSDGDPTTAYVDKSGNGYHLQSITNTSKTLAPVNTQTHNGFGVFDFDTTSMVALQNHNLSYNMSEDALAITMLVRTSTNMVLTSNHTFCEFISTSTHSYYDRIVAYRNRSGPGVYVGGDKVNMRSGINLNNYSSMGGGTITGKGVRYLLTFIFNGTSSSNPNVRSYVRINGTGYSGSTYLRTATAINIGHNYGTGENFHGVIGEVIIYKPGRSINWDSVYRAEGYIAHKWNETSALPSTHPYKTTIPQS